jgi:hypothetical protein
MQPDRNLAGWMIDLRGVRLRVCQLTATNETGGQPQCESVPSNTWTESGQTPILRQVSK